MKKNIMFLVLLFTSFSQAAIITSVPIDDKTDYIKIEGIVTYENIKEFNDLIVSLQHLDKQIEAVYLDARDNETTSSALIANTILENQLTTVVLRDKACVGGCYYMFAAGAKRISYPDSLIAVHRLTLDGEDNFLSKVLSLYAIKGMILLDSPASVILKMITRSYTKPYYLSDNEKIAISTDWDNDRYYDLFLEKQSEQELKNMIEEFDRNNK